MSGTRGACLTQKWRRVIWLALLLVIAMAACGGASSKTEQQYDFSNVTSLTIETSRMALPLIPTDGALFLILKGEYSSEPTHNLQNLANWASWTSSNPSAATVDRGVVRGAGSGIATITATLNGKSTEIKVVVGVPPTNVRIEPIGPFSMGVAPYQQFQLIATYEEGLEFDVTPLANWIASAEEYCTFDIGFDQGPGFAFFHAPGITSITATPTSPLAGESFVRIDIEIMP